MSLDTPVPLCGTEQLSPGRQSWVGRNRNPEPASAGDTVSLRDRRVPPAKAGSQLIKHVPPASRPGLRFLPPFGLRHLLLEEILQARASNARVPHCGTEQLSPERQSWVGRNRGPEPASAGDTPHNAPQGHRKPQALFSLALKNELCKIWYAAHCST